MWLACKAEHVMSRRLLAFNVRWENPPADASDTRTQCIYPVLTTRDEAITAGVKTLSYCAIHDLIIHILIILILS